MPGLSLNSKTNYMKQNMGYADRIVRIVIAVIIGILYYKGAITGTGAYVLLAIGAIFLLTSLISFCPLYALIGIKTCQTKKAAK